ncbi:MAG: GIY-YIG nuclease family protein [Selenomonadaceae bacterium]|nr:GIY-YIG nuclease family protein [Selenomonadaceae bacterium]
MGKCIAIHPSIANRSNVIYIIIHRKTGCVYIGQTQQRLKSRILQHCNQHDQFIDRIIHAEGTDAFEVGVLDFCNSQQELNEREQFWIKYFNCTIPHGFNSTNSARLMSRASNSRRVLCIETSIEYSSIAEAARQTGALSTSISRVCRGDLKTTHRLHFVFVNNSADELKRFSQKKRPILCIETGKSYESIAEAARQTGLLASTLSEVCNGKIKTFGGFNFVFADTPEDERQIFVPNNRRVLCIETNVEYISIRKAAQQLGISHHSISKVCNGKQGTAGGLHFEYVD